MAGFRIEGNTSGNVAEVDAQNNLSVNTPGFTSSGVIRGGGSANGLCDFSEIDNGAVVGTRDTLSGEVDDDYRLRGAGDNLLMQHVFTNDTAQDTTKTTHDFITLTATQSTAGMLTNSGAITTTTTGMSHGSRAMFRCGGTETLVCETALSFSAQPNANTVIDFGLFIRGAANPFAPLDGVYFRMSSAGMFGVINSNGTEVSSPVFPLALGAGTYLYTNNKVDRYLIQVTNVRTTFWINNVKMAAIPTPIGLGFPCMSQALPWSIRHSIVGGAAGAATQCLVKDFRVFLRGPVYSDSMSIASSRSFGAYQGLTAATLGSLGTYTNNTNPAAAVPTNTTLAVGASGLLNQAWETFSLAVNTDGIIQSYQVPVGTATTPGRRLKVLGVKLSSYVQTVLAGGPISRTFTLNFGHTAVSLATAETGSFATASTKARRVVLLPEITQHVTAAQAVNTAISQPGGAVSLFPEPIYVNPGEFVAVSFKGVGTVGVSGVIVNHVQVVATFE
jgi:hypothetical protein